MLMTHPHEFFQTTELAESKAFPLGERWFEEPDEGKPNINYEMKITRRINFYEQGNRNFWKHGI